MDLDGARTFRQSAERQQDEQNRRIEGLDRKLAVTFPINAGFMAVLGNVLADAESVAWFAWVLSVMAWTMFAFYAYYAVRAFQGQQWSKRPNLADLRRVMGEHEAEIVDEWTGREIMKSVRVNEIVLRHKSRNTRWAFFWTVAVAVASIIAIVASAIS